ncbi:MAG: SCO family protein [Pseudomonadota bacterium]
MTTDYPKKVLLNSLFVTILMMFVLGVYSTKTFASKSELGGNFELTTHSGERFELSDIHGKVGLIFFGFTHCPDVCPTTLLDIQRLLLALDDQAEKVQVLFISVDPKRDTPDKLEVYVKYFNESIIGLTGSTEEIAKVLEQYRGTVSFSGDTSSNHYNVEHNSNIFLIDKQGDVGSIILPRTPPFVLEQQVRKLIDQ